MALRSDGLGLDLDGTLMYFLPRDFGQVSHPCSASVSPCKVLTK